MRNLVRSILLLTLLCGAALGQTKQSRIYIDTADPAQSSTVTIGSYLPPSHGEQVRTLQFACPALVITEDPAKADFILRWESKTWQQTSWKGYQQEYTLYNPAKEVLGSGASHHIKNAAKDICKLIAAKTSSSSPGK